MKPALLFYPHVSSYPVLLLLGFLFGWVLGRHRARQYGLPRKDLDNIALILPLAGLFGARFFARLFYARLPLLEALKVWQGDGLVFYGGFFFAIAAILAYGLARRMPLIRLLDCLAPSAALGLAFGRVGCFLAGCCWGDVCIGPAQVAAIKEPAMLQRIHTLPAISRPDFFLAVEFPPKSEAYQQHAQAGLLSSDADRSLPVHPVQLYEAFLAAALCIFLCRKSKDWVAPGSIALGLLAGYAVIRFGTEFLRADNKIYAVGLTFSQFVSIWILAACAILLAFRAIARRHRLTARWAPEAAVPCK